MSGLPPEARLGNDIARQFAHLPEAEAVERLAAHMRSFWTPQMRATLRALVASGSADLDPLVVRAAHSV
jgi:formate dehydrogenase subunit delta